MDDLITPLNQSEAFERTCRKLKLPVRRISTERGTCLVQQRKWPLIGTLNLISRGPVLQDLTETRAFLSRVRRQVKGPLIVNAIEGMDRIDGLNIAAGAELALLDLTAPEPMRARLHQKWRNQLCKAERSRLQVTNEALDPLRHRWFLKAEAEQQKTRRYKSYPAGFPLAYAAANEGRARVYTASLDGEALAAMLFLEHGGMATYQAGVTTAGGRARCAHNLLLWQAMIDLQQKGFCRLDLGRVDLTQGLRRFKSGTGARIERLSGSFLSSTWLTPRFFTGRSDHAIGAPVVELPEI
ncbi:MAG: GNAT family N-acetyltransferase [Henriciella sp.]